MINCTLKEYVEKQLQYHILTAVEGVPKYNCKEIKISDLTFDEVKFVMKALGDAGTWDSIKIIFGKCFRVDNLILDRWFWNGKVKEFYQARNYIIKEFNRLIKQEQQLLKSVENVDTVLWKQAGGGKLNRFGGVLPLNQLGKLYGVFPFELKHKKYEEILILLTVEKETAEVQRAYNKLKQRTS